MGKIKDYIEGQSGTEPDYQDYQYNGKSGFIEPIIKILKKEPVCRYEHECTSRCMNDIDCPCQDSHCCAMSDENCGDIDNCEYCHSVYVDSIESVEERREYKEQSDFNNLRDNNL